MGDFQPLDADLSSEAANAVVKFAADAVARIGRRAAATPQALALLHKHRGQWEGWRWNDVSHRIEQLRDGLQREGLDAAGRLAVSGAFEPDLILLALAAHALGAAVIEVDRFVYGDALRARLEAASPTHAFVQDKKTIAAWIDSGYVPTRRVPLYTAQSVAHDSGAWQLEPVGALSGAAPDEVPRFVSRNLHRALRRHTVAWVEQGTEWAGGLAAVLQPWLDEGVVLAAPEVSGAATRDRHEVQPDRLLVSPGQRERLLEELNARLPASGSWTRRLTDRARGAERGVFSGWLRGRIATLHGLPAERHENTALTRQTYGETA